MSIHWVRPWTILTNCPYVYQSIIYLSNFIAGIFCNVLLVSFVIISFKSSWKQSYICPTLSNPTPFYRVCAYTVVPSANIVMEGGDTLLSHAALNLMTRCSFNPQSIWYCMEVSTHLSSWMYSKTTTTINNIIHLQAGLNQPGVIWTYLPNSRLCMRKGWYYFL